MNSLILQTATRYMLPLLIQFSIFIFLRGHNEPGGGFVGGLVAAAAFALYAIATSAERARALLRIQTSELTVLGLTIAIGSALFPLLLGDTFMRSLWTSWSVPFIGKLGVPFFFDLGIYFTVIGVTLTIILTLAED